MENEVVRQIVKGDEYSQEYCRLLKVKNRMLRERLKHYRAMIVFHRIISMIMIIVLTFITIFHFIEKKESVNEQIESKSNECDVEIVKESKLSDYEYFCDLSEPYVDNYEIRQRDVQDFFDYSLLYISPTPSETETIKNNKNKEQNRKVKIYEKFDISFVDSNGFKSYMPYDAITNKTSKQYELQKNFAYTGDCGIRMIQNRYCVAIGTHFNADIGQYFDLVLENGTIIECVLADVKADCDTDSNNIMTNANGCVSEFIVDMNALDNCAKQMGDISYCFDEWKSRVVEVRIYEQNVYDESGDDKI